MKSNPSDDHPGFASMSWRDQSRWQLEDQAPGAPDHHSRFFLVVLHCLWRTSLAPTADLSAAPGNPGERTWNEAFGSAYLQTPKENWLYW